MRVLLPLSLQGGANYNTDSDSSDQSTSADEEEDYLLEEETAPRPEPCQASEGTRLDGVPVTSTTFASSATTNNFVSFHQHSKRAAPTEETSFVDTKKRPRPESKPAPQKSPAMAGGQRIPLDEEESKQQNRSNDWAVYSNFSSSPSSEADETPLENEPPSFGDAAGKLQLSRGGPAPKPCSTKKRAPLKLTQEDLDFITLLKKRGLEIVEQEGDGNCLFRAVALQVYGDAEQHGDVRMQCLDFMARDADHFGQFVTGEPFAEYIARKRQLGVHGNNPEIQAISELFNRPVEVFTPETGAVPLNIFHSQYKTADVPIGLSYHDGNHYNAVIDPLVPTAGLGLGLPGLKPGLADKLQVAKAVAESDRLADQMELKRVLKESEDDQLQRTIKENSYTTSDLQNNKAMALSDLDATNFELEQAVLESSIEAHRREEHGRKQRATTPENAGRQRPELPTFSELSSTVAAIPSAAASVPSVASAAAARVPEATEASAPIGAADEYPQTIQELVMNGFELARVVRAYELIGDNFDDLLAFLMSSH